MTTLIRNNSSVRLSLITDAFARLRLQHTGSLTAPRHPIHLRFFSQTRLGLLKNPAGIDLATTLDGDFSSPKQSKDGAFPQVAQRSVPEQTKGAWKKIRTERKFNPSGAKWTEEEDRKLFRLIKEDANTFDIYTTHFQYRSLAAVTRRITLAHKAARLQEQQAIRGVHEGEDDVGKSAAGEEGAVPLRVVYTGLRNATAERRDADRSDDAVQRSEMCRADTSRRGKWTSEEDALLEQLVRRFIHLPDPSIWHKVAGGQVDNAFLLRSGKSCLRRWRHLHPPSQGQTGRWSMEEDRLMQEAISEQFEGKYQVLVDVFMGQPPAAKDHTLAKRRPQLQQLPSQSELPILKSGSRRLRMLNWVAIAERVQSRTEYECRDHFYSVYHNAEKGSWSEEELERLEEGLKMFEKDYWKIAEHVRTRSPLQVGKLVRYQQRTGKPMQQ